MDKEQQDKNWSLLSEDSQTEFKRLYEYHYENSQRNPKDNFAGGYDLRVLYSENVAEDLSKIFGVHNLKPEICVPKTWDDIVEITGEDFVNKVNSICTFGTCSDKLYDKISATAKIYHLIDLGYGGVLTDKEWKDKNFEKFGIYINNGKIDVWQGNTNIKDLITFRSKELRDEFMSYVSNLRLVHQYYMI